MTLLETVRLRYRIWNAASHLGAEDAILRRLHRQTLYEAGPAAIPKLRELLREEVGFHAQCGAAIVLHRLGDPAGLRYLASYYTRPYGPPVWFTPLLEAALIEIGTPDVTTTLIALWQAAPPNVPGFVMESIARVWVALRDPRALDALCARALLFPALFAATAASFGEAALPHLTRMTYSDQADVRLLAVQTLSRLAPPSSFQPLVERLRDRETVVRGMAAQALAALYSGQAGPPLRDALEAGWVSPQAVQAIFSLPALPRDKAAFYDLLGRLVARWHTAAQLPTDDEETIAACLALLPGAPWPSSRLVTLLCDLLERQPSSALALVCARTLTDLLPLQTPAGLAPGLDLNARAHRCLLDLLTCPNVETRRQASVGLRCQGDSIGLHLQQQLVECWPSGSWTDRVQTVLRGGPEAEQTATQAVQQAADWLSRVSRDVRERLSSGPVVPLPITASDPRLHDLLPRLLANALAALNHAALPADIEALAATAIASIRLMARLSPPALHHAQDALVAGMYVHQSGILPTLAVPFDSTGGWLQSVRLEAVQGLLLTGADGYTLFTAALHSPNASVQNTAILALGRLGDARALPTLLPLTSGHQHGPAAQWAVDRIRRAHPETITLLRGADAPHNPNEMLRPVSSPHPEDIHTLPRLPDEAPIVGTPHP